MALGMGLTITTVLSTLLSSSVALNVNSKTNVAVYYVRSSILHPKTIAHLTFKFRVKVLTSLA